MNLDRSIAAVPLLLALCFLSTAASAQVRAPSTQVRSPSAIASARPVPAASGSAPLSLDPDAVLAYTRQQLADRDRELQQMKQQQQFAKTGVAQPKGQGVHPSSNAEVDMLRLQSNVSKRSSLVQSANDLIKSQATAASAAKRVGH